MKQSLTVRSNRIACHDDERIDGDGELPARNQRIDVDLGDLWVRAREATERDEGARDRPDTLRETRFLGELRAAPRSSGATESAARSRRSTSAPPWPTARTGPNSGSRVMPQNASAPPRAAWRRAPTRRASAAAAAASGVAMPRTTPPARSLCATPSIDDDGRAELGSRALRLSRIRGVAGAARRHAEALQHERRLVLRQRSVHVEEIAHVVGIAVVTVDATRGAGAVPSRRAHRVRAARAGARGRARAQRLEVSRRVGAVHG